MKIIKFDLPIDGVKVRSLDELRDHFTAEIVSHYRTGILSKWLRSHGFNEEYEKIQLISADNDHKAALEICRVFSIEADEALISILLEPAPDRSGKKISDFSVDFDAIAKSIDFSLYLALRRTCIGSPDSTNDGVSMHSASVFERGDCLFTGDKSDALSPGRGSIRNRVEKESRVEAGEILGWFDLSPYASDYVGDWYGFLSLLIERESLLRELACQIEQPALKLSLINRANLVREIEKGLSKIVKPDEEPDSQRIFLFFENKLTKDQRDAVFVGCENLLDGQKDSNENGSLLGLFSQRIKNHDLTKAVGFFMETIKNAK